MQSVIWKGKRFTGGDQFVNRFPGFEAIPASGRLESSWTDGRPAYVLDYPAGSPLFGPNRDELREVAPGVWLGRVWNRQTPGQGRLVVRAAGEVRLRSSRLLWHSATDILTES